MVGRILWFRVDRFSVPCPRVIVITALPEDMSHLSENDVPMNVPFSFWWRVPPARSRGI